MTEHENTNAYDDSYSEREDVLNVSLSYSQHNERGQEQVDRDIAMAETESSVTVTASSTSITLDHVVADLVPNQTFPAVQAEPSIDNISVVKTDTGDINYPVEDTNNANAETASKGEVADGYGTSVFIHDFSIPCTLIASTYERYNVDAGKTLEAETHLLQQQPIASNIPKGNNFFRNAKWSPDGMCILTNSNDDIVRLFNLPSNIYGDITSDSTLEPLEMQPALCIREGESVYDFEWFPAMSSQDPATWCFLTSVRDHPVRLWDAGTGKVRASYSVIDHQERFIGPNVVRFNLDASKQVSIYCGYNNMIEIFDTQRPGQESQKVPTVPKRRSKQGQKGLISCLDFSPDYSGLYAAGSYSQTVGIYDETNNELCLKLTGIEGGVTQVRFSLDGSLLFTASRQANSILCWDIRNTANVLYEIPRIGKTNQRISFDIDATGTTLVASDQNGYVTFYDIKVGEEDNDYARDRCLLSFEAHRDIATCATFNPTIPVIATTSGQRKYNDANSDDESDDVMETETEPVDNSLKIWRIHGSYSWYSYET